MATELECRLSVESKIGEFISLIDQKVGETTTDIDDKIIYGYEQTVLNNIKTKQSQYSSIIIYNRGDIVTFDGKIYVCKSTIVNENPSSSLYWELKEFDKELTESDLNIVAFCTVKDGVIVDNSNIDVANCSLDDEDGYANWNIKFEQPVTFGYTVLFSDISVGDQAIGSSKIGLRKIRNATNVDFDVQFQSDSLSYNDLSIFIYGTKE